MVATRMDWRKLGGDLIAGFERKFSQILILKNPVTMGQYDLEMVIIERLKKFGDSCKILFRHRVFNFQDSTDAVTTMVETPSGTQCFHVKVSTWL